MNFLRRFFAFGTAAFIICMIALILIWTGVIPDVTWGAADSVEEGLKASACAGLFFGFIFAVYTRD